MKLTLPQHLIDQAIDQGMRIMFHGCGKPLEAFSAEHIGPGGNDNSALGLHLAEYPAPAAEFADAALCRQEGDGVVLAVLVPAQNVYEITSYDEFFGFNEEGNPDPKMGKPGFAALRTRLLEDGYDIVDYEDGEMGAVSVMLDPGTAIVVGCMSIQEAYEIEDRLALSDDALSTENKISALYSLAPPTPARRPKP